MCTVLDVQFNIGIIYFILHEIIITAIHERLKKIANVVISDSRWKQTKRARRTRKMNKKKIKERKKIKEKAGMEINKNVRTARAGF